MKDYFELMGIDRTKGGYRWRGQYIKDEHLPLGMDESQTKQFLREAFYENLPWLYATNRNILEEVAAFLLPLGISCDIKPFINLECRWGLYCKDNLFEVINDKLSL